ncbi:hypothetical protein [Undibacterium sp. TS12]|uniref:hypothetical protein n=1 Tax=Undibacterium sp. TS12 TaxID=2908202 RepID=UPI001F4CDFE2|nr:hypothetical protein [Undibacterium sp. TS12]MCH8622650.1 hypothetical protein [Undibacterium sp. TS12]
MSDRDNQATVTAVKPASKSAAKPRGRPKKVSGQTLSQSALTVRDAIARAGEELGGASRLAQWAREDPTNEKAFWTVLYLKILPLQVNGAGDNGEHLISDIAIKLVKPNAD